MPNLSYGYLNRASFPVAGAATCVVGGPGAVLPGAGPLRVPTWPALLNAQHAMGIYPLGWANTEAAWRLSSVLCSSQAKPFTNALCTSPVVDQADPTDKGQLSYHLGMAAGLEAGLALLNPGPGVYFPFHLTRAEAWGGTFTYHTGQRPDLLLFSLGLPPAGVGGPPVLNHFVVWECKGRARYVGNAPLGEALVQSLSLATITALPFAGVAPLVGPFAPAAYVASKVDVQYAQSGLPLADYRFQITDPEGVGGFGAMLPPEVANGFLRAYYAPYVEMLENGYYRDRRSYNGQHFETATILPNVRVGMESRLLAILTSPARDSLYLEVGAVLGELAPSSAQNEWINQTGISTEMHKMR